MASFKSICFAALLAVFVNEITAAYINTNGQYVGNPLLAGHSFAKFEVTKENFNQFPKIAKEEIDNVYESTKTVPYVKSSVFEVDITSTNGAEKSESFPKFNLTINDISKSLNHSIELAKEQVNKAVDIFNATVNGQLQEKLQKFTNALYACSKENGIEHVPVETIEKVQACLTEATKSAKTYVDTFLDSLKPAPELVKNMSSEVFRCLDEMQKSSSLFRATTAAYCIAKASAVKGGEAASLAAKITYKGFQLSKDLTTAGVHATKCYTEKMVEVAKELYNMNGDVAKCTENRVKAENKSQ